MQNLTYESYLLIDFLPTFLVIFVAPLLFVPVLGILCLYNLIRKCCCSRLCDIPVMDFVSKHVFKNVLHKSKTHPDRYVVAGYRVPKWYIFWLFPLLYGATTFAAALFWDNFLLEVSTTCNPNDLDLACFSFPGNLSDYPLDCSDTEYLERNNLTFFVCFKFVLDFGNASGAAGGIFFLASIVLGTITVIILKCSQCQYPKGRKWPQRIVTIVLQVFGFLVTLAMPVILFYAPILSDLVYRSIDSILQLLAAMVLVLIAMTTPWCYFEKEDDDDDKELTDSSSRHKEKESKC